MMRCDEIVYWNKFIAPLNLSKFILTSDEVAWPKFGSKADKSENFL